MGSRCLSYLGFKTTPTCLPKHICTFLLRPHGVAVTVMVTFTGASGDSCAESEPGIVDGVSMPKRIDMNKGETLWRCLRLCLKGKRD